MECEDVLHEVTLSTNQYQESLYCSDKIDNLKIGSPMPIVHGISHFPEGKIESIAVSKTST